MKLKVTSLCFHRAQRLKLSGSAWKSSFDNNPVRAGFRESVHKNADLQISEEITVMQIP